MRRLFAEDARRFENFSLSLDDLLLDFSKTSLSAETIALLCRAAEEAEVCARRDAMFAGALINTGENRAALHVALRAPSGQKIFCGGKNIMPAVGAARKEMLDFAEDCRSGRTGGADGKPFSDAVNIGIGGSELGAAAAVAALRACGGGLRLHFVSSMDGAHLSDVLAGLDARRTLVVVSSKSFATAETMLNARAAAEWLAAGIGSGKVSRHLVAATAEAEKARAFGAGRVFMSWDWVGGRFSVWGAAGLPLALAVGAKHFNDFLAGARAMDEHFCTAPPRENLPLMLGMIGVWHRNICGYAARAVLPYNRRLHLLPAYLQQLDMESNGKPAQTGAAKTAPVVWGGEGTNAQHAYAQMLHQGTDIVPCEFIFAAEEFDSGGKDKTASGVSAKARRRLLAANCFAQSAALMLGKRAPDAPRRDFPGGRPSLTLVFRRLAPHSLGRLLALFEHRAFVEGALWGVNSFDQWGVELGKTLASRLHANMDGDAAAEDSSTRGLLAHFRGLTGG